MSLRARFAAASSAVAFVTLSGASTAVWVAYTAGQERQLDAVLLAEARNDAIDASLLAGDGSEHRLAVRRGDLASKYAAVYDASGRPVVWTPNLEVARPQLDRVLDRPGIPFDMWWNNEHLRAVLVSVPRAGEPSLLLATPRTDLDDDARDLAGRMAVAVLVAVAVSAALTFWLSRFLTRDHERIAAVARAVTAGDLSARIGSGSGDPELAQLARDVDEMISRLAVLVETQQRFIANASHELRSPLTTLLGELSFALRRERDAAEYRRTIEEALDSTRRLRTLADDLLMLARIGAADLEREAVSLPEVVRGGLGALRSAADAREVVLDVACDEAVVEGRAGDLERLVRNLVENAVRHSPRGGRVRVESQCGVDAVQIVVADEGPGVPEDLRERVFEPFFRRAADRAEPTGAGLGLAIGRSIARAHGGDLHVEDPAPGERGARFVVRLPAAHRGISEDRERGTGHRNPAEFAEARVEEC